MADNPLPPVAGMLLATGIQFHLPGEDEGPYHGALYLTEDERGPVMVLRARRVVIHADDVLKIDCGGVGERIDVIADRVERRRWDGDGDGAGYGRHPPEIPMIGPPIVPSVAEAGQDGGPPWDRFRE